ncbi:MAG: Asp-tRNA(Asn)/Glu-tRNA(Gln) amidotransferase GatCAB subunit C [Deltaproteobacteria bacterium]|jgi:aspartyl-tRNA(Asn)/glutamyl-tRNA(Gln) amidotransferase subunit C|nr:Asp-tRNA(Asn)/Glu-tRNA(Gln) amidotransferase GatCAB subunit C [Deltaproteobacteria bacterium]MBQ32624.1 Asp-tRNA(Asn)/Glu-tRNA(Gln) amidotransferase GatCAB subunit C [Deltaproteobacteria bacterium]MDP7630104.1 Asp-tRNA(Asn)/Glu-tRNA(Gln) amidotransferase subunit GatC [SAR324 cluster bacterium]
MSAFSIEEVRKIAKLASLALTPEEEQEFARQFGTILDYFERLNAVELPENAEAADPVLAPRVREDRAVASPVTPEQFSPYLENRFFKVPRVIDA